MAMESIEAGRITPEYLRFPDVLALTYYPVKAMKGISLIEAHVGRTGIDRDRGIMVTTPEGHFLTQRELPKLALIAPKFADRGRSLVLTVAERLIEVPLIDQGQRLPVEVWKSKNIPAIDLGNKASGW